MREQNLISVYLNIVAKMMKTSLVTEEHNWVHNKGTKPNKHDKLVMKEANFQKNKFNFFIAYLPTNFFTTFIKTIKL